MIKVMIVDDSAVARAALQQVLATAPDIQVCGSAPDPLFALEKMRREWPDLIITGLDLPRMDGVSFVRRVMSRRPTPVVLCAPLHAQGTAPLIRALAAGAVGIITRPEFDVINALHTRGDEILATVRAVTCPERESALPPNVL